MATDTTMPLEPGAAEAPSPASSPAPARSVRRPLDDVPLRSKIALIVVLAAAGGALVGVIEVQSSQRLWPFIIGLTALLAGLMWLCDWWVWSPMDRLLQQLDSIRLRSAPGLIHKLPASRQDEIGKIARTLQQVAISSIRHECDAKQVRRTMDARVEDATKNATRHLRKMALRDPLTDLANRRFMEEHLESLVASATAAGSDLVCVAIDVDNFKQVNDTLGHDAGDELLLFLASIIRGCIRRDDYAIRLGGDEFVLLLPGCTIEQARQVVERIHSLFRSHVRNTLAPELRADLSLGVASVQRDGVRTGHDLLKKADHHLYDAKRGGKGRAAGT